MNLSTSIFPINNTIEYKVKEIINHQKINRYLEYFIN